MKKFHKDDLMNINGGNMIGPVTRVYDSGGVYLIDWGTGKVYNIFGQVVYEYMGDW